ncbi:MAG: transketolase C-terminal domain-containing protein [Sedimenticola sp.]
MKATREWFSQILTDLGEAHPQLVVVDADLGSATRSARFGERFPERFYQCGIAEANALGIAAGLAQEGFRPLVSSFGAFLTGKFIEIFQSVALNEAGVILVGTHAGLAIGKDGPTQMGLRDLAVMRSLHNMEILHPADGIETRQMLEYALSHQRPTYLRLCRQDLPELHHEAYRFQFGQPGMVAEGDKLLIATMGGTVAVAVEARQRLAEQSISAGVLNISSMPVDGEALAGHVAPFSHLLVVEDHAVRGGLADELAAELMRRHVTPYFSTIGVTDYAQAADPELLWAHYGLDSAGIVRQAIALLEKGTA